ncbi:MAG: M42 family metallopeptidase [Candidatus Aenigmarchaeota archaeon]|nr:M42 family metallopeptidase [Candidatus Aenigmarchaeota archaeon]
MTELLKRLVDAGGISGNEAEIRAVINKEILKYVDETSVDSVGNLIAHKKGKGSKVMLAAHTDEVGLMVKGTDDEGNVYFSRIGGIEPLTLIGQRVKIKSSYNHFVDGVITTKEISNSDFVTKLPEASDLFIDTGHTKEELEKKGVNPGDFIVLYQEFGYLKDGDLVYGKALDDRVGCYILIELAKKLQKTEADIYYVFTVQEEIGLYGAKISAYKIQPNWAIAVDATGAEDKASIKMNVIGKGPAITLKDSGMITNSTINGWLAETAKKHKIPLQYDVNEKGSTDALSISFTREGVPSTIVGIPIRNLHSTIGIASMNDINNAIKLLFELLHAPPKLSVV